MRRINIITFITMDGIMQAPGGPHEDPSHGFRWGGWQAPYPWDEKLEEIMGSYLSTPFDLLLGRRTYQIFAAYWPYMKDDVFSDKFNSTRKYVISSKPVDLTWNNSVQIKGDIVQNLRKLKEEDGSDLLVYGSGKMVQTLLANDLVDSLHLWTYPITLGKGKRLFAEGTKPASWKLVDATVSSIGIILGRYEPAGEVKTGSFNVDEPSKAELERRKKWVEEE